MRVYEKYKDSGIAWLGEIPNGWGKIRLKDFGFLQNGISKGKEYFGFGFPFVSYFNVFKGTIRIEAITNLANSDSQDQILYSVKEGDVLFTRTSETIEEIGIASTVLKSIPTATFSGFVIRFRPTKHIISNHYSKYLFRASFYRNYLCKEIAIVTRASLNQNVLGNLVAIIPPLSEQKVITRYLDSKTNVIDNKLNLLQQKINIYTKLSKSLINDAVTKGLDKKVELKPSGVDCIGNIPQHWSVKRIKEIIRTKITDGPHETPEFTNEGIPFLSVDGIVNGELFFKNCRLISVENFKKYSRKLVIEKDDIFIGKAASTGKIARVKVDFEFTVWSPIAVIKTKSDVNPVYVEYAMKSNVTQYQIVILSTHNTQSNIAMKDIPLINIAMPPLEEQNEIAQYLEKKTSTIDAIVTNIGQQIVKLTELRKSLINDVVTGKIKVTT
jgi:type I restriction enzyme S subunit